MNTNETAIASTEMQGAKDQSETTAPLQRLKVLLDECLSIHSEQKFMPLANYLMNSLSLVVKGEDRENHYRIIECEIYYSDKANRHFDPYTHRREEQATFGKWYFNDFGLDITIGSKGNTEEQNIYGGILIRSIYSHDSEGRFIHGPSGVVRELFTQLGSVFNQSAALFLKEVDTPYVDRAIYSTPRVNLPKKEEDYYRRPYRFLSNLTPANKIPGKEALVRRLLESGPLSEEQIKQIEGMLAYKLKR